MGAAETFHGYAPDLGYEFLRSAIAKNDYESRGCDISADEIFVSDGALPDGPKVGSVAVSPRGDLRMPSDASARIWMEELEALNTERR